MKKFAEFSFDEKRRALEKAFNPSPDMMGPWVRDVFDDRCVIDDRGEMYEVAYTVADDGAITLGERKRCKISYETYAELQDIEIFETGTYRGTTYTEEDLDAMVRNFGEFRDQIKPTAVIGHSEDQPLLKDSGVPAAGWMTALRRSGSKLIASFSDVPKVVADLIGRGAYRRISSEVYDNFKGAGKAIRRVAILGGEIPEVKTLQDIAALYADDSQGKTTWVNLDEGGPKSEGKENEDMDVKKFEELQTQVTRLSETVGQLQEENKTLKAEKESAVMKLSETQTAQKKADIHQFCENLKRDGKLIPAMQDMGIERFMESLDDSSVRKFAEDKGDKKAEEMSSLGFMKKFMESFGNIVRFGETAPGAKPGEGTKTADLKSFQEMEPAKQREFISAGGKIVE